MTFTITTPKQNFRILFEKSKLSRSEMPDIGNRGIENRNIGCSLLENIGFPKSKMLDSGFLISFLPNSSFLFE